MLFIELCNTSTNSGQQLDGALTMVLVKYTWPTNKSLWQKNMTSTGNKSVPLWSCVLTACVHLAVKECQCCSIYICQSWCCLLNCWRGCWELCVTHDQSHVSYFWPWLVANLKEHLTFGIQSVFAQTMQQHTIAQVMLMSHQSVINHEMCVCDQSEHQFIVTTMVTSSCCTSPSEPLHVARFEFTECCKMCMCISWSVKKKTLSSASACVDFNMT